MIILEFSSLLYASHKISDIVILFNASQTVAHRVINHLIDGGTSKNSLGYGEAWVTKTGNIRTAVQYSKLL